MEYLGCQASWSSLKRRYYSGVVDRSHMSYIARCSRRALTALVVLPMLPLATRVISAERATAFDVTVGAQYDTTHVYVAPGDLDSFVSAFTATFGGNASRRAQGNVLPVPSHAALQYVWTPVGTLSVFGFDTPLPFPFARRSCNFLAAILRKSTY